MAGIERLKDTQVKAAKATSKKRRIADGGNLYLVVRPSGSKTWAFIYKEETKTIERGLGSYPDITLADARETAQKLRKARQNSESLDKVLNPPKGMTFGEAAQGALELRLKRFRSHHTVRQWKTDLFDRLSDWQEKPIKDLSRKDVIKVLRPVVNKTPESGRRFRTRIEAVFSYAIGLEEYEGANPARWKDGLASSIRDRDFKTNPVKHHSALDYSLVPKLMEDLKSRSALSALCLRFTILTAARTTQARGARWDEIDLEGALWTIQADRMKAGRLHKVPLSKAAIEVLEPLHEMRRGDFVFPSHGKDGYLSDAAMLTLLSRLVLRGEGVDNPITIHGFRSTLLQWIEHETTYARDLAEHSLAHAVGSKAFRSYSRDTSRLEQRRELMEAWGRYVTGQNNADVVALYG